MGISALAGICLVLLGRLLFTHVTTTQVKFTPHEVHTVLQPPKGALQGLVNNVKGEVSKQGRKDTDFRDITKQDSLVEGESLATTQGTAVVTFGPNSILSLGRNTQLDFLNGLPSALVVRQPMGTITYTISSPIPAFSVRSLGLLTQFAGAAKAVIMTDTTNQTVTVRVISGSVTVAYSDADNTTQVKDLGKGETAIFDYTQSTLTLE